MNYLLPLGGTFDPRFKGILTSYKHYGIPAGIKAGHLWAGDNCAFKGFDANEFTKWLQAMTPYRNTCLFIVAPDAVGDANRTLDLWDEWAPRLSDWPLALAAQDGMEDLDWPTDIDITDYCYDHLAGDTMEDYWEAKEHYYQDETPFRCVFIGGSTEWKDSYHALTVIEQAQRMQKHVHIGRVNHERRYTHFARVAGSEHFTCDGTLTRSIGKIRALHTWSQHQNNLHRYRSQLQLL